MNRPSYQNYETIDSRGLARTSPNKPEQRPNNARTTAGFQKKNIRKTIKTGKNPNKPEQGPNTEEVYEPCVLLWEAKMKEMPHEKC